MEPAQESLRHILGALREISRRARREAPTHADLTYVEESLLYAISDHEAPTGIGIAAALGIDKSTASRQLATLEQRGLVRRHAVPGERRAQAFELTGPGRQLLSKAEQSRLSTVHKRTAGWSAAEVAQFEKLLARFNHPID